MRSNLVICVCCLTAILSLLVGCAASKAPSNWLPSAQESQWDGFGSWANLTLSLGPCEYSEGELIAVTDDSLYILGYEKFETYGRHDVSKVHIQSYDASYGGLAAWTVFGTLSIISHGFVLILSAPIWIITGTIAASSQSYAPHKTVTDGDWKQLRPYCRYPGGLPPSFDRWTIKPKPVKLGI